MKKPHQSALDTIDAAIINALQTDGRLTAQELAEKVSLSPSQCARRKQRLEEDGIIQGYKPILNPAKVGLNVIAMVQVVMAAHSRENAQDFINLVRRLPEILDVWTLTGEADYLLRVAVQDLKSLNELMYDYLLAHPTVARVQSQVVLEELKTGTPLPINIKAS